MFQPPLEQEIVLKYQTLPPSLRDALESHYGLNQVREIAKRYSLIGEDVEVVVQLFGLSLLGFLNPRNLAEELFNFLELRDKKAIDSLTEELIQKIFVPLKPELQNLYRTPSIFPEPTKKSARQPEVPAPASKEAPAPAAETQPKEQPVPIRKEGVVTAGPVPVPLEALRIAPEPAPTPKAEAPITPLRPAESLPTKIHPFALGEMPVRSAIPAAPAPTAAPATKPATEATPAPFMLHKEEAFTPIMESKQIQIKSEAAPRPETGKPTAVRLEMTGLEEGAKKKEGVVAKTEIPQQRVVHYSTFRTPINPFGTEATPAPAPPPAPALPKPGEGGPQAVPTAPAKTPVPGATPKVPPVAETRPRPAAQEEVIDLSTFQRTPRPASPHGNPAQPKLDGNVVDLRGRE